MRRTNPKIRFVSWMCFYTRTDTLRYNWDTVSKIREIAILTKAFGFLSWISLDCHIVDTTDALNLRFSANESRIKMEDSYHGKIQDLK